jgi:hypothetical protein
MIIDRNINLTIALVTRDHSKWTNNKKVMSFADLFRDLPDNCNDDYLWQSIK